MKSEHTDIEDAGAILADHLYELQLLAPKNGRAEYSFEMSDDANNTVLITVNWKEK